MPDIDPLLDQILARGGGDLHLSAEYPPMTRVLGELVPLEEAPLDGAALTGLLLPLLTMEQRVQLDEANELTFTYAYGQQARFRASYFRKASGLAAVFRTVPTKAPSLAELGLPEVVRRLCERRSGLLLVTGGAGVGKTSTFAAIVAQVNETRPCHILTVEDPIEFVHTSRKAQVTQREVGSHAPTMATALRSAARDDVDVLGIGELQDAESTRLALRLASGGLLVVATVRASGVRGAVERVVTAFAEGEQALARALLAESFVGALGQHLLPTADESGQALAVETLLSSPPVVSMLREGRTSQLDGAMQAGQASGMQTLDVAFHRLVQKRRITLETALARYADREAAERRFRSITA